MAGVILVVW